MVTSNFGSAIGNKFNSDGTFRAFAGNTMVSALRSSQVFPELCDIQRRLLSSGRGEYLMPLPPDSFHMTVFEGVCDQVRDKDHWSCVVPDTMPIDEVSRKLAPLFESVPPMGHVEMRLSYLRVDTGISIGLVPKTEEDEKIIRDYRDQLAQSMGICFPGHKEYGFHIGLAYGRMPAGDLDYLFEDFQKKMKDYFASKEIVFTVPRPDYCTFKDMSCFTPWEF